MHSGGNWQGRGAACIVVVTGREGELHA